MCTMHQRLVSIGDQNAEITFDAYLLAYASYNGAPGEAELNELLWKLSALSFIMKPMSMKRIFRDHYSEMAPLKKQVLFRAIPELQDSLEKALEVS